MTSESINTRKNIIAGPGFMQYWNHSPGLERPIVREEGPFPIQGNVGPLIKAEATNYSSCRGGPSVGAGPNCSASFVPDVFSTMNTCGDNCVVKEPEFSGGQNFGLIDGKLTNAHGLHAYKNVRAPVSGQGPADVYGCFEWIPRLGPDENNMCAIKPVPEYEQVGDWTKLKQADSIVRPWNTN